MADENYFTLLTPPDKPTHNRGNDLYLALGAGSIMNISKCCIATHLDAKSDHLPLLTTIGWARFPELLQKLRLKTLDMTLFQRLLAKEVGKITPLLPSITSVSIDKLADYITEAIYTSYNGSVRRSLGHIRVNLWWTDTCRFVQHEYRAKI